MQARSSLVRKGRKSLKSAEKVADNAMMEDLPLLRPTASHETGQGRLGGALRPLQD